MFSQPVLVYCPSEYSAITMKVGSVYETLSFKTVN